MNESCEWRVPEGPPRTGYKCAGALNFGYLGPNLEVCRTCPVPRLLATPHCRHLDIFPCLRRLGTLEMVGALFYCTLGQRNVDSLADCQGCPAYEPIPLLGFTAPADPPGVRKVRR